MDRTQLAIEDKQLREEREGARKRIEEIDLRRSQIHYALAVRADLSMALLVAAAGTLAVHGAINESRRDVVRDAKDQIIEGGGKLHREWFGTKNYAAWSDQRCDTRYGFGPSHGSIVFSIGLRKPGAELSDEQIAGCLYALDCLDQGLIDGPQLQLIQNESTRKAAV